MEDKILKALTDLSCSVSFDSNNAFRKALEEGSKSLEYTKVVKYLTDELRSICGIDEQVNEILAPEDSVAFLMEVSSFLKELGCPFEHLVSGHVSDRLSTHEDKLLLLDYLTTELMAARMIAEKNPEKKLELKLQESHEAANLRKLLMTLRFPKPPSNITVDLLFKKLIPTVQSVVQKAGDELLGMPILNASLKDDHWNVLNDVQKDLHKEYTIRREMLLKRLDCTIQSFQWSDKTKGKEEQITKKYCDNRKQLKVEPDVSMADLICARTDLAIIEKTSSASIRKNTKTSINKVIIGQVPDRGGRTSEQAPPPPEMPSWQQRNAGPVGGGGRGRGGNQYQNSGGRGGYNQGGGNFQQKESYSQGGGNYNQSGDYGRNSGNYGNNYNRGGDSFYQGSNSGSYRGGNSGNDYNRGSSAGSYSSSGSTYRGGKYGGGIYGSIDTFDKKSNYSGNSGNRGRSDYGSGRNYQGNKYGSNDSSKPFDSAGSYDNAYSRRSSSDFESNEPKRPKTYDSFQSNKNTYADQYVQESQHNEQYRPRNEGRGGRGRSNYNRGGHNYR